MKRGTNLEWRRLDNSDKIFPISGGKKYSTVFRLSAILKENVDKKILEEAVKHWAALANAGIIYTWITVIYSINKNTNIAI